MKFGQFGMLWQSLSAPAVYIPLRKYVVDTMLKYQGDITAC